MPTDEPFSLLDFVVVDLLGCALPRKRSRPPPREEQMRMWPTQPDADDQPRPRE